jgi:hypothetical protein
LSRRVRPCREQQGVQPVIWPWLFVTVETHDNLLPPSELYELAPEYLQYLTSGSPGVRTSEKTLVPPYLVQQGGLSGSAAALTVVSPGGQTSIDELACEKGDRLWLVIAGCSASCYDEDHTDNRQRTRRDGSLNSCTVLCTSPRPSSDLVLALTLRTMFRRTEGPIRSLTARTARQLPYGDSLALMERDNGHPGRLRRQGSPA